MIIANNAVAPTMSGGITQSAKATIKSSARLFNFFSDMVYGDKFVAIWRELVANGVDSHVVAGNTDTPVVVTLPTTFTPYAKVRDFGTGMSHVFLVGDPENNIESKFMAYTDASTKEDSNELIGGFGIGSKSPLSYTEQFAIHSYQDGKCRIYSVFKDDQDCPEIAFLSESDTDEPDGIEISFPVEQTDITKFKEAAYRCLNYFNPLPVLKNTTEQLVGPDYTVRADNWGFRKGYTESQVVQGGVAYPIDKSSLPTSMHEILDFGIDFYVPIGSVGISLSRESLSYDERTIRVIGSLCDGIRPQIQDHINKMFESYPTKWEAMVAYNEAIFGRSASSRMIESLAHYKGEKLTRQMQPVLSDKVLAAFITNSRYSKRGQNQWTTSRASPTAQAWIGAICPSDIKHILIDDADDRPVLRARNYLEHMADPNEGVMLVRKRPDRKKGALGADDPGFTNDLKWEDFIKEMGSPKVVMLSTIEPAVVTRNGTTIKRPEKIRGYKRPSPSAKFVDTLPVGGGYYIEMNGWTVLNISTQELAALDTEGKPVLYFGKGDFEKVKDQPNWVSAKSKFLEQMKTYKREHKFAALANAFHKVINTRWGAGVENARLITLLDMEGFACPKRGPLAKLITLHEQAKPDLTSRDAEMRNLVKLNSDKQDTMLAKLFAEIWNKHPELHVMLTHQYPSNNLISVFNKLI